MSKLLTGDLIEYCQEPNLIDAATGDVVARSATWLPGIVVDPVTELPDRERAGQAYNTHGVGASRDTVTARIRLPDGRSALRLNCEVGEGDGQVRRAVR